VTAAPAPRPPITSEPSATVGQPPTPLLFDFSSDALKRAGFQSPVVGCPRHGGNAVIVRYDDGPDLASPGIADQVAQIVWANEPYRFDLLAIESRGTTVAYSYSDLEERFGPPPIALGSTVESSCGARFDLNFDKGLGGAAAFAIILLAAIGIVGVLGWLIAVIPKMIAGRWNSRQRPRQ
jgi:hypothetical protein